MNFTGVIDWTISQGNVTQVIDNQNKVIWTKTYVDYTEPFYIQNIANNTETFTGWGGHNVNPTIEYSYDKTNWNTWGTLSEQTDLSMILNPGDKVYFRSNALTFTTCRLFGVSKIGGNIMSLLYGSNFTGQETAFPNDLQYNQGPFDGLFYSDTVLQDASDLLLPAMTLHSHCYQQMFAGCTSLTSAPLLPALILEPACYEQMFRDCTSLIKSPLLFAPFLVSSCYRYMFMGCTSLTNVVCLAETGINTNSSTAGWLYQVGSLGTFTKAVGATWPTGTSGIPTGWTVVEA